MLSVLLLVKAARGNHKIDDLEAKGLLKKQEREAMDPVAPFQRAMVPWAWILSLSDDAYSRAGLQPAKITSIAKKCCAARDGVQTIHTYLHTQLPYAYVHLITLLVNLQNLVLAVKCGMVFADAYHRRSAMVMA